MGFKCATFSASALVMCLTLPECYSIISACVSRRKVYRSSPLTEGTELAHDTCGINKLMTPATHRSFARTTHADRRPRILLDLENSTAYIAVRTMYTNIPRICPCDLWDAVPHTPKPVYHAGWCCSSGGADDSVSCLPITKRQRTARFALTARPWTITLPHDHNSASLAAIAPELHSVRPSSTAAVR